MTLAKKAFKDYRIPLLAVLIFVIMSLVNKNFFTPYNIFTIADSISGYGIVALGFTFILLVGQLDISFGSVIALSACIFMMMLQAQMNFLLALLAAIAVGCACGAVTGFFVATFRLSPFIVSMTMQLAYKGIALTITNQTPVSVPHPMLQAINNIKLFNIFPIVFFFFLLLCVRLPGMFFPRCRETSCFQHEEKQNNARGRDEFQRMIHMEFCYGFFPGKTKKVVNVPMLVRVSSSLQEKADHSILMRPSLMSRAASRSISF